jgi:hypothetical protein
VIADGISVEARTVSNGTSLLLTNLHVLHGIGQGTHTFIKIFVETIDADADVIQRVVFSVLSRVAADADLWGRHIPCTRG